jgi:hypothetical protein
MFLAWASVVQGKDPGRTFAPVKLTWSIHQLTPQVTCFK